MMKSAMKFFVFSIILANVVLTIQAATVLETLESLKYTEYLDMVKAAGLDSKFNDSAVTWTVFAANNTGVNATLAPKHLVISNITSNATESKDIVEYTLYNHTLLSDDIKTGTTILTAVNGMNLTVVKNTTGIFVNGIMVIKPNITADKSVIYEMESLLIPPDVKFCRVMSESCGVEQEVAVEYVILNVPTWLNKKDLTKALVKAGVKFESVKKLHGWNYSFISFRSEQDASEAKVLLESQKIKGFQCVLEQGRNVNKKRKHKECLQRVDDRMKQVKCSSTSEELERDLKKTVADVVAPWRHYSYAEQIRRKRDAILAVLSRITSSLKSQSGCSSLSWLKNLPSKPCCILENVVEMPEIEGARLFYRNKNEFTIGFSYREDGTWIETVGFSLGLFREGEIRVDSVNEDCVTTSKRAIAIANILEGFVRSSHLPVYDKRTHKGFWRQATVREGFRTKEVVVFLQVQTEGFERDLVDKETRRMVEVLLSSTRDIGLIIHGIVLQEHNGISNFIPTDNSPTTLFGQSYFHEQLMDLTFRIGVLSFFQTNTFAAERLLEVVLELGELTSRSTVLDLCCGTGTIGICLASKVAQVIGIELVEEAVNDAKANIERNNILNMTVMAGKVEDKLKTAVELSRCHDIVAIADPPRAGLHPSVIKTLRNVTKIKRLVYISCNPNNLVGNAVGLCRPKSNAFRGEPFKPIKAVGVDMFPYTEHVELVMLFQRIQNDTK